MQPGNEAGKYSLGTRLGSAAWEQGWGVQPGNEAGECSLLGKLRLYKCMIRGGSEYSL